MRESPILFSAPMVRAILDGSKTATRRVVKPYRGHPLVNLAVAEPSLSYSGLHNDAASWGYEFVDDGAPASLAAWPELCPYGQPGHRLWIKERWHPSVAHSHGAGECDCGDVNVAYRADGEVRFFRDGSIPFEWTMPKAAARGDVTPLFMPRWASRITLEVVGVRVERLQDISEADAIAEGVDSYLCRESIGKAPLKQGYLPICAFSYLWDQINGTGDWDTNPWVWVVKFKRVQP